MKEILIWVLLFFLPFLEGCSQAPTNKIVFKQFPKEEKLKFDTVLKLEHTNPFNNPYRIFLKGENLLACDGNGVTDYFFHEYDLGTKTLVGKYIKGGRSTGQALSGLSSGFITKQNTLWMHDIAAGKLLIVPLSAVSSGIDSLPVHEYLLPAFYYSTQLMTNLKLLCSGSQDTSNTKLQVLDLESKKIINSLGKYDDIPDNITLNPWRTAMQSFLYLKPSEDKAVLCRRFTDQIEFLDLKTGTSEILQGPENFKAEFTLAKVQGRDISYRSEKSRFAFVDGVVTNNFIYLLYSGNVEGGIHKSAGQFVYVFNWLGKPVRRYQLDRYVSCITVSENNATMYAFDPVLQYIVKTKL